MTVDALSTQEVVTQIEKLLALRSDWRLRGARVEIAALLSMLRIGDPTTSPASMYQALRDPGLAGLLGVRELKLVRRSRASRMGAIVIAAAEPEPAQQTYTCCVCQSPHCVRESKGVRLVVLHGYQRPGYGYTVGRCFGANYEPYEHSCRGCEDFKLHCELTLDGVRDFEKRLRDSAMNMLSAEVWSSGPTLKLASVEFYRGDPKYEEIRQLRIRECEARIPQIENEIVIMAQLIRDWKP